MLYSACDEPTNPHHLQLIRWADKEDNYVFLRLYDEMAPHWKELAVLLGLDTEMIGMNNYHEDWHCIHIRAVMKEWKSAVPDMTTYQY